MTPQEKALIQGVFDRLAGGGAKDEEAHRFIREQVLRLPDAPYGLVQAVVMLEAGINQAQARITELQRQLDEARAGGTPPGGGFLGSGSPWSNGSVPRSAAPLPSYQPAPAFAPPPPPAASPWAQPSGGSSFLRNAATMAAGVAGGTLLAEGLSNLLGGHHYGGGFGGGFGGPTEMVEQVTVNNYYDQPAVGRDSVQDASYDDSAIDGGYDDSADI